MAPQEKKQCQSFCIEIYSGIDCKRAIRELNEKGCRNRLENAPWPSMHWIGPHEGHYIFLGPCGYAMIADCSETRKVVAESEKEILLELVGIRDTVGFLALDDVLHITDGLKKIEENGIILRPNKGNMIRRPQNFGAVLWTGNDATALKERDVWVDHAVMRVDGFSHAEVAYALAEIFMYILIGQVADKSLESHDWTYEAMRSFQSSIVNLLALLAASQFRGSPSDRSPDVVEKMLRLLEQAQSNVTNNMEAREKEQGRNNARLDYLLAVLAGAAMISTVLDITEYGFTHWDELLSGHWSAWLGGAIVSSAVLIGIAWVVWATWNKNK